MDEGTREDRVRLRRRRGKRLVDVALGLLVCLAVIPVVLVLALVVAVETRSWPFFSHERLGHGGRIIRFPKLRTLPKHVPQYARKDELPIEARGRFTAWLRQRHLDELPQLFLVPLGKLSLVGPRPKMPDQYEPSPEGYRDGRLLVPQGCTGLWQISEHASQLPQDAPQYDFTYVQYGSVRLDLWILWRTALLTFGRRTVTLDDVPSWALAEGFIDPVDLVAVGAESFAIAPPDQMPHGSRHEFELEPSVKATEG